MADVTVPTVPPLATLPNVELIHAGTWRTKRTPFGDDEWTATTADLANAVTALDCPAVRRPILKLGHTEPHGKPNPGQPAVGWIGNLATAEQGHTLVGDYVGMPGWLGEVLASAYPDRSVEAEYDYVCQLGHTHPFVLHAVALLGVDPPGIGTLQSLQDVAALYGVVASSPASGTSITFTVQASTQEVSVSQPRPPVQVAASVTSEDVRRAYYAGPGDSWDQWIESMELDPLQLIVMDDAKGKRYRVPVTVGAGDGEAAVSFGDPVEVVIRYEDAKATATAGAGPRAVTWASRTESRPGAPQNPPATPPAQHDPAATAATDTRKGSPAVDFTPEQLADLRARLGLAADAELGPEQVLAALGSTPSTTQDDSPAPQPTTASAGKPGTMIIDASAWEERETRIKRLEAEAAKRAREERDQVIAAAVQAGKFPPARKDHWVRLWDADPEGTRQVLAGLQPNVVPVDAVGHASDLDAEFDAEFAHLFPPATTRTER